MNRTSMDATVKRHHQADHDQLRRHLQRFFEACDYDRQPKTRRGLTP